MKCVGYEQITDLSSSVGLSAIPDVLNIIAFVQAEGQNVRWRQDGDDPDASTGMLLIAADSGGTPITLEGNLKSLRFIEATSGGILNVSYFHID